MLKVLTPTPQFHFVLGPIAETCHVNELDVRFVVALLVVYVLAFARVQVNYPNIPFINAIWGLVLLQFVQGGAWWVIGIFMVLPYCAFRTYIEHSRRWITTLIFLFQCSFLKGSKGEISEIITRAIVIKGYALIMDEWEENERHRLDRKHNDECASALTISQAELRMHAMRNRKSYTNMTGESVLYMFDYTQVCSGVPLSFKDYLDAHKAMSCDRSCGNDRPPLVQMRTVALRHLTTGIVCLGLYMVLRSLLPIAALTGGDIGGGSWLGHFGYMQAAVWKERLWYYFVWKVGEGGCVLAGYGDEKDNDGNPLCHFRGAQSVDIYEAELCCASVQAFLRNWNKMTQRFLERYVYHNLLFHDMLDPNCPHHLSIDLTALESLHSHRWTIAFLLTFFVSWLLHGQRHPKSSGLFFCSLAMLAHLDRLVRHKVSPRLLSGVNARKRMGVYYAVDADASSYCARGYAAYPDCNGSRSGVKRLWFERGVWWLSWALLLLTLNYLGLGMLLPWGELCVAYGRLGWVGHKLLLAAYALLLLLPGPAAGRQQEGGGGDHGKVKKKKN